MRDCVGSITLSGGKVVFDLFDILLLIERVFMETESVKAKPFLKLGGGKGQLLTEIQKYYPFADKK
mgnify:CR=1 FL=1